MQGLLFQQANAPMTNGELFIQLNGIPHSITMEGICFIFMRKWFQWQHATFNKCFTTSDLSGKTPPLMRVLQQVYYFSLSTGQLDLM
jgi:hypothetical protein